MKPRMKFFNFRKKNRSGTEDMGNNCCGEPLKAPDLGHKPRDDDVLSDSDNEDDIVEDLIEMPKSFHMAKGRQSVSAEAYGEFNKKGSFKAPVHHKTPEQSQRIRSTLKKSFLFSGLDEADLETVTRAFVEKNVSAGVTIIQQGEDGDSLYLLEKGECEVWKQTSENPNPKLVFVQTPGDAFGELALLYNCPRAATVKAKGPAVLWSLDRESFNHIVKDAAARKRELHEDFLKKVDLLKDMDPYERCKVADALKTERFKAGSHIIDEGDVGDTFYMIESGCAEAMKDGKVVMSYCKKGDYFGELSLIRDQPRAATIVAKTDTVCVSLDRRSFKRLLGPIEGLLKRNAERYTKFQRHLAK